MELLGPILEHILDWLGLPIESQFMWQVFALIVGFLVYAVVRRHQHGMMLTTYFIVGGIALGVFLFSKIGQVRIVALAVLIISGAGALSWDLLARRGAGR